MGAIVQEKNLSATVNRECKDDSYVEHSLERIDLFSPKLLAFEYPSPKVNSNEFASSPNFKASTRLTHPDPKLLQIWAFVVHREFWTEGSRVVGMQ